MALGKTLEGQVRAYRENVETWKADHAEAMVCLDLQETIRVGIGLYDQIDQLDEEWRLLMAEKKAAYSKAEDDQLQRLFDAWLDTSKVVDVLIRDFEKRGYKVDGAEGIRERLAKAQAAKKNL